jgi:glycine dehydrogenase subunit 1
MRYFSHTSNDIKNMLSVINLESIDSLFKSIPENLKYKSVLNIPRKLEELELKKFFNESTNQNSMESFIGGGLYKHFVPETVKQIINRGEWLTCYTPYQAEVSQGTLQSIFEFQTVIASIYGCEVANASLYDCGTAIVEGILMSMRITKKDIVVVPENIHPEYINICKTYSRMCEFKIIKMPFNYSSGEINLEYLEHVLENHEVASVLYQYPNFLGQLENQESIISLTHKHNALSITINPEPLIFGISKPPGLLDSDIVVGEGVGFCPFTGLGTPSVGLFATKKKFLRFLPGRLVGITHDKNGKKCFVLTLATREQHIRRDRATSNICTNNNLNALACLITLSLYGKSGFYEISKQNIIKSIYFRKKIEASNKVK